MVFDMLKKSSLLASAIIALSVGSSSLAIADGDMEKCKVVKDGKGLIKEHKADCKTESGSHGCAGHNAAGDPDSWIFVPKGQCEKINAGDFSGVSAEIKDKIEAEAPQR